MLEFWAIGLRGDDAFLNVPLPGFVVSYSSFGLLARQFHFLGYIIDPGGSIFLLIKAVAWRPEVDFVSIRPFCFYFFSGLDATSLWHAAAPSGRFFRVGILTPVLRSPQPSNQRQRAQNRCHRHQSVNRVGDHVRVDVGDQFAAEIQGEDSLNRASHEPSDEHRTE